ncbi:MAG: hypothetical protein GX675_02465 [Erysipelotrichaceae bacterium]|nr:hypothetical protein [Erysipelotrichaceae bacterium]
METKSTLRFKRIIITSVLFFAIPFISNILDLIISNSTISYTFSISLIAFIFIIYNWDLFALHYNRSKKNIKDTVFYTIVGLILLGTLTFINQSFIHGYLILCDKQTLTRYYGGAFIMIVSHTLSFSLCMMIAYKSTVDRIKLEVSTVQVILFSGLIFALLFSIFYVPLDINLMVSSFLYYSIFFIICSYLYNQCGSFIPAMISITLIFLFINILQFI